jgi:hypothetical protein
MKYFEAHGMTMSIKYIRLVQLVIFPWFFTLLRLLDSPIQLAFESRVVES